MKPSGQWIGGRGQETVQQFSAAVLAVRRRLCCSAKVCDLAVRPTEGLYLWSPYGFHLRCASVSRPRVSSDLSKRSPAACLLRACFKLHSAASSDVLRAKSGTGVSPVYSNVHGKQTGETPVSLFLIHPLRRNKSVETGRAGCPSPPFCGSHSNQTSDTGLPFNVESVFRPHSPTTQSSALGTARPTLGQGPNPPGRAGCPEPAVRSGPNLRRRGGIAEDGVSSDSAPCPTTFRQQPTASLRLSTTTRSETIPRLLTIRSLLSALCSPISNLLTSISHLPSSSFAQRSTLNAQPSATADLRPPISDLRSPISCLLPPSSAPRSPLFFDHSTLNAQLSTLFPLRSPTRPI